jgi:hypothetical protein
VSRIAGPVQQLFGDSTVAAVAGVATFSDLTYHTVGTGFTLRASFTGLVSGNSNLFDVKAAPADHLVFTAQPHAAVAGVANSPNIAVTARDQFDNTDLAFNGGGSGTMTLAINTGPGAIIAGATAVITNGVASFSNVQINLVGVYTLNATSGALSSPVASNPFAITAAAANHLEFTQQPSNAVAGVAISPAIVVTAKDQFGNTDPTFTGGANNVTLSVNTGVLGVLVNTIATPAAGVATFATFNIETAANFYSLKAAGGSIVSSPLGSNAFNITPAAPDHFTFVDPISDAVAGTAISPAIVVDARDAFDNIATSFGSHSVTLSISSGPGVILSGATVAASGGTAVFSGVSIDLAGAHTLDAINTVPGDCPACTPGTSSTFNITHAAATKLGFTQEPGTTAAGATISPSVLVAAQDPFGNTDLSVNSGTVTLSISVNPGGGVLSGTLSRTFSGGVATFDDLSINNIGTGYRLLAVSSPVLTQILSALFDIN